MPGKSLKIIANPACVYCLGLSLTSEIYGRDGVCPCVTKHIISTAQGAADRYDLSLLPEHDKDRSGPSNHKEITVPEKTPEIIANPACRYCLGFGRASGIPHAGIDIICPCIIEQIIIIRSPVQDHKIPENKRYAPNLRTRFVVKEN